MMAEKKRSGENMKIPSKELVAIYSTMQRIRQFDQKTQELFEAGKVVPVIDRSYPLSEGAEAFRYFGEGHVQGKIVITM